MPKPPRKRTDYHREYARKRRAARVTEDQGESLEDLIRRVVREELRALVDMLTVNQDGEALPKPEAVRNYWKPDPMKPRESRCQATTRAGTRCAMEGKSIVRAMDSHGCPAEFVSCERHQDNFRPHPSIFTETP